MSTTLQIDLLALADIQAHIQDQQAQIQAQLVEARKELEDQSIRRAEVQKAMTEKRHELGQMQTWLGYKEQDVRSATADLEHSRGTSLEDAKKAALAAAQDALGKAKHESAHLVALLESDALAERNFTEQIDALVARIEQLSHTAGELAATHERFSAEQCGAIKEREVEALGTVQAEIDRLLALLTEAYGYYDKVLAQAAQHLSPWPDVAETVIAEYLRIEVDTQPAIVALKAQLTQAEEEAARGPAVSWEDDGPTHVAYARQVNDLKARIAVVGKQIKQRQARELLGIPKPPTVVVEVERVEPPLVVIETS